MVFPFRIVTKLKPSQALCFIGSKIPDALVAKITSQQADALKAKPAAWQKFIMSKEADFLCYRIFPPSDAINQQESLRKVGADLYESLMGENQNEILLTGGDEHDLLALAEGLWLRNYRFENYKSEKSPYELEAINFLTGEISEKSLNQVNAKMRGIYFARDLVNEPANVLTASEMAKRFKTAGSEVGYKTTILGRAKIESLKMGGLLAVNRGSTEEPTFSILEYSPVSAINLKPIVLIGKGIVYDTGGLSLKPTANSMDIMKCDMGGAAAVAGAMYAIALAKLPVKVTALIPATDNQPGPNAYKPGDVITMYDGTRVEVMNTDAEGRLVLADALAYASKLDPELVLDFATLTGSSLRALSYYAAAMMGTASVKVKNKLVEAAFSSWERVVEFPLWDDYSQDLKSEIADTKNIGASPMADVIIAGKFLERFTDYPWMHTDIAGPAFLPARQGYLPKGATGFGVGLLFHFLKDY